MDETWREGIFTRRLPGNIHSQFIHANISELGIDYSVIFRVRSKNETGKCYIEPVAVAFDTKKDYDKLAELNTEDYIDLSIPFEKVPVVHIAEEEILYTTPKEMACPQGAFPEIRQKTFSLSIYTKDGFSDIESKCLLLDCPASWRTMIEPFGDDSNIFKKHALLASHSKKYSWLKTKKRRPSSLPPKVL